MKAQIFTMILGLMVNAGAVAQTFGPRDSADNQICKSLQNDIYERDYRVFDHNQSEHFKLREDLDLYANPRGQVQCYAQILNKLGNSSRDRNSEPPTEALMYVTADLNGAMLSIIKQGGDKGRTQLGELLVEFIDLNGIHLLAYGVQSSNQFLRQYSFNILTWVTTNKNFCVINDHIDISAGMKTENGKKGIRNLLSLADILAPDANRENYGRIVNILANVDASNFSSSLDLGDKTAEIIENLKSRLAFQKSVKNPPMKISNPEFSKDCGKYGRRQYGISPI